MKQEFSQSSDRPVHVLHFVSTFAVKTDTKWLLQLARHFNPDRVRTSIACFYEDGPMRAQLEAQGVTTFNLNTPGEHDPRAVIRARRLIRESRADVVHTHLLRADLLAGAAVRLSRGPAHVSTVYAMGEYRRAKRRRFDPLLDVACSALPHHFIAVSEAVRRDCILGHNVDPDRVTTIHTGIEPVDSFDGKRAATFRREHGIPTDAPLIVTIARLSYEKGIETLIESAETIRKSRPDARVVVVGDGPDRDALTGLIRQKQLDHSVYFAGFTSDVWPAIYAADVIAMPSHSEGLPNALLEAMAVGKPIVATSVGGIPEAISHEESGLLVSPGNPRELADGALKLLTQREDAARMANVARNTASRQFSVENAARRYARVYRQLWLDRKGAHATNAFAM